ncbi:MAG: hypothetical protein Q7S76_03725 [bacterium]|nr:hypothetical protein [bacterium]
MNEFQTEVKPTLTVLAYQALADNRLTGTKPMPAIDGWSLSLFHREDGTRYWIWHDDTTIFAIQPFPKFPSS